LAQEQQLARADRPGPTPLLRGSPQPWVPVGSMELQSEDAVAGPLTWPEGSLYEALQVVEAPDEVLGPAPPSSTQHARAGVAWKAISMAAVVLLFLGSAAAASRALQPRGGGPLPASTGSGHLAAFAVKSAGRQRIGRKKSAFERDFCNASAVLPVLTAPAQRFDLPKYWRDMCKRVAPAPGIPQWPDQNRCWEWMKAEGCYSSWSSISWSDGQVKAADKRQAPYPDIVPMQPVRHPELCEHVRNGAPLAAPASQTQAAVEWMRKNVAVYVLNLPDDTERWQAISSSLTRLGLEFQRLPGADLTVPGAYALAKAEGRIPQDFSFSKAQATGKTYYQAMNGIAGAMGCAAGHLAAMAKVAADDHKPLALILEDDVVLADDIAVKLHQLLEIEAPCDWVAISLKTTCPYGECVSSHLTRVRPDANEPADRCRHGVNYGFYGMLYRVSTLGALHKRLSEVVWDDSRPRCLDVDVALASISDEVAYYAVPRLQAPGFLTEGGHGSSRIQRNVAATANLQREEQQLRQAPSAAPGEERRPSGKDSVEDELVYYHTTTTTGTSTTFTSTSSTTTTEAPWWQLQGLPVMKAFR